jgi:hypothetical protein
MGIFSFARRQRALLVHASPWLHESDGVIIAPGAQMDDDGCEGEYAYGAQFYREDAPGASLTIWAYPAPAGPVADAGSLFVGYRIEYEVDAGDGSAPWSAALPEGDVEWADWYESLGEADDAAREAAEELLRAGARANPLHIGPEPIGEWFSWDGVPW